jgi:hypothetical protein
MEGAQFRLMKTIYPDWNFICCWWQCYLALGHTHIPPLFFFSAVTLWHWNWMRGVICRRLHLLWCGHYLPLAVVDIGRSECYTVLCVNSVWHQRVKSDADFLRVEHVKKLAVNFTRHSRCQNVICVFVNLMWLGHNHS